MTATLDAVGIVVSDLARAVRFYRVLGLSFPEDAEHAEHGHAEAELESGFRLLLDTEESIRSFDPAWERAPGSPAAALAFRCSSPKDVDALFASAIDAGGVVYKEPWDAFWGMRYAQLRDPDGNGVDLYAPLKQGE
jgi:catechol 2,3-dioxygenase-like lactoylglutathione lyase family enzyme